MSRQTSLRSSQKSSQTSTFSAEAFLANLSQSQEIVKDLKTPGELSFLKSLGLPEPKSPRFYSSRMLRDSSATMTEKLSGSYSRPWMNWGMMLNGRCLTANTGESHKTVRESLLSDILEKDPDPKYFLSTEKTSKILDKIEEKISDEESEINVLGNVNPSGRGMNGQVYEASDMTVAPTLTTNKGEGPKILDLGDKVNYGPHHQDNLYTEDGVMGCLRGSGNASHATKIIDWRGHKDKPAKVSDVSPTLRAESHGHQPKVINHQMRPEDRPSIEDGQSGGSGILFNENYSYALTSSPHFIGYDKGLSEKVRRLTPRECWRLQGFPDESFEKAENVNSDTQLYKQAGNAVTVDVIEAIGVRLADYLFED